MAIDKINNIRIQTTITRSLKEDADVLARINGVSLSKLIAGLIEDEVEHNRELIEYRKKDTGE